MGTVAPWRQDHYTRMAASAFVIKRGLRYVGEVGLLFSPLLKAENFILLEMRVIRQSLFGEKYCVRW